MAVFDVSHKSFHSGRNGAFIHDGGGKKSEMTLWPFEPAVKYHCFSSSPERQSLNTTVRTDIKSMRTFKKAEQRL